MVLLIYSVMFPLPSWFRKLPNTTYFLWSDCLHQLFWFHLWIPPLITTERWNWLWKTVKTKITFSSRLVCFNFFKSACLTFYEPWYQRSYKKCANRALIILNLFTFFGAKTYSAYISAVTARFLPHQGWRITGRLASVSSNFTDLASLFIYLFYFEFFFFSVMCHSVSTFVRPFKARIADSFVRLNQCNRL